MKQFHVIKKYGISSAEHDTYERMSRAQKESSISLKDVRNHWNIRAQRTGLQTVMSARHTLQDNVQATKKFNASVIKFIKPYITNKSVFELGVGVGRMTVAIAQHAKRVIGNDFSPVMIKKARTALRAYKHVTISTHTINQLRLPRKSFDLVFESIVLLHILKKIELLRTIRSMQRLSNTICIIESANDPHIPHSKYTIIRKPREYVKLFTSFKLIKKKYIYCAGDRLIMMLFQLR